MIVIERLRQDYGKTTALSVDHEVIEAGTTALVGHNGAGKSTLLMITAGLIRPTTGSVTIDGNPAGGRGARALVSFVPDQPALFDDLTLWDQMVYVARLHARSEPDEQSTRLVEILDAFDLLERFPNAMSKGQRQKASLLVATARPCTVLLADEPTTGLDASSKAAFISALGELVAGGMSVISSTHDDELIQTCDRSLHLRGGRIVDERSGSTSPPDEPSIESADRTPPSSLKPGQRPDRWSRGGASRDPID